MKTSPLQLERCFVAEVVVTANKQFDSQAPIRLFDTDIKADCQNRLLSSELRQWECVLKIRLQPQLDANLPYGFSTEWIGIFRVMNGWAPDKDEFLVRTSAPAVLFSMAREHLRANMASGPFPAILLPTVNFSDAVADRAAELAPARA